MSSVSHSLPDQDTVLMLRVRDQDDAFAFEQLVIRYQARLLQLLFHFSGDHALAEDMLQDVFLRLFRARHDYQPQAKFATWLFTIAQRVACNARRTSYRRREVQLQRSPSPSTSTVGLEHLAVASSGQMPTRAADRNEATAMVQLAIAKLPDRQRMALLLSRFEHMSYAEIGHAMELSQAAVKSLLSRARESLRESLMPFLDDGTLPAHPCRTSRSADKPGDAV